jgi:hypothetical protein
LQLYCWRHLLFVRGLLPRRLTTLQAAGDCCKDTPAVTPASRMGFSQVCSKTRIADELLEQPSMIQDHLVIDQPLKRWERRR